MPTDRRHFLNAIGGAGAASLVTLGAYGVQSRQADLPTSASQAVAWEDPAKLSADDGESTDFFGRSAALSADGRTALIGAPGNGGSAYIFTWDGSSWNQETKLILDDPDSSRDTFGYDVALSATGDTALVTNENDPDPAGASSGSAYVFTRSDGSWSQQAKLTADDAASGDHFGQSGALTRDGTVTLIGSDGDENDNGVSAGSAYVYTQSDGSWSQQEKLVATDGESNDELGLAVALAADGRLAFVAAGGDSRPDDGTGSVYVFQRSGGSWSEQARITPGNTDQNRRFGFSISVTPSGTTAVVGAPGPRFLSSDLGGVVYVFSNSGGSWSQQARLTHGGGGGLGFAESVALSDGGSTLLAGTPSDPDPNGDRAGSATVFTASDGSWTEQTKLSAPDGNTRDNFGTAVALAADGNVGLVGAGRDEDPNGDRAGSAYVSGGIPEDTTPTSTPGSSTTTRTPGSETTTSGGNGTSETTEVSETESSGDSGPGFGVPSVVVSLATATYLLRARLRDGSGSE